MLKSFMPLLPTPLPTRRAEEPCRVFVCDTEIWNQLCRELHRTRSSFRCCLNPTGRHNRVHKSIARLYIESVTFTIYPGITGDLPSTNLGFVRSVSPQVSPEREQLTGSKSPCSDCRQRIVYSPPHERTKSVRPTARPDMHLFESRK